MIIEQIRKYMDESEWSLFNESLTLMRSKAATAERQILKALDKSQEEACHVIARQDMFSLFLKIDPNRVLKKPNWYLL